MNQSEKFVSALPFNLSSLEGQYGRVRYVEAICPGVYYLATTASTEYLLYGTEYFVVMEDSPAISSKAKSYGTALPTIPRAFLFEYDYASKGRHVVAYEAHKYLAEHGRPLPEGASLTQDRAFGMEICPEYFGEFPVPIETPWGPPVCHDRLWNGLYWLETAEAGWVLAIAYPLCSDLFDDILEFAVLTEYDREKGIDNTCGYRFYTYENSCCPIHELLPYNGDTWGPKINTAALKNALLAFAPVYSGENIRFRDYLPVEQRIYPTPGVGTDFYQFP